MVRRTFVGMTMVLAIGGAATGATAHRVSGVVTAATDKSLQIASSKETTTVNVDDKTAYMKWITHQPWQQDNRAKSQSVSVGSCVEVELRGDEARVAKIVRVNADPAGSVFDPCKTMRQ